jgi:ectoine hydroxylase-related dioxygenase (phytanoyl-CoA dioxygenase family)
VNDDQDSALSIPEMRGVLERDGVVHVPAALKEGWIDLVKLGIRRNMANPGPYRLRHYQGTPREFVDDYCNYHTIPEYRMLLDGSPIVDLIAGLLGSEALWLFYEQIFVKDLPATGDTRGRRTPWHQDSTYWVTTPTARQQCGCWITVTPTPAAESLEFVRGSHLGPTYAGTMFDPDSETTPFEPSRPLIPDVEADRDAFDIVSFAVEPGDLVVFHPNTLHGGGSPIASPRRTLSIRFYGDDIVYEPRAVPQPPYPGLDAQCRPGDPLRGQWFPQLRDTDGRRLVTL